MRKRLRKKFWKKIDLMNIEISHNSEINWLKTSDSGMVDSDGKRKMIYFPYISTEKK